ncbi:MAG: hypothetical protein ABIR47_15810, partial [Candidatus Kapaibacterium sp.]
PRRRAGQNASAAAPLFLSMTHPFPYRYSLSGPGASVDTGSIMVSRFFGGFPGILTKLATRPFRDRRAMVFAVRALPLQSDKRVGGLR